MWHNRSEQDFPYWEVSTHPPAGKSLSTDTAEEVSSKGTKTDSCKETCRVKSRSSEETSALQIEDKLALCLGETGKREWNGVGVGGGGGCRGLLKRKKKRGESFCRQ